METIKEKQREFIEIYNRLGDPLMQYEFLLQLSGQTPLPDIQEKKDSFKIENCQTDSWLIIDVKNCCLYLKVDSDSLLIRGILSIYVYLLNGRALTEIIQTPLSFMEETQIRQQVSLSRFNILSDISKKIYEFCVTHLEQGVM